MDHLIPLMAEALNRREKILVFIPQMDPVTIYRFVNEPSAPYGFVIATEQDDYIGKSLATRHQDISIPIIDAGTVNVSAFDRIFIPSPLHAAKYALKAAGDFGFDPLRIHLTEGLLAHVENNIYKADNKYDEISRKIELEGGCMTGSFLNAHIYDCLHDIAVRKVPGDIVNLGVYKGWSMKYFLLLLDHFGLSDKKVIGFDTFDGFVISDVKDICSTATREGAQEAQLFKGIDQ